MRLYVRPGFVGNDLDNSTLANPELSGYLRARFSGSMPCPDLAHLLGRQLCGSMEFATAAIR
jgi:hypothetical protein